MDARKITLEEFLKMCDEYVAENQKRDAAKFQNHLNRIIQTCATLRDCYFDCGASVVFASSRGKDEKINLSTYCDTNYAVTVAAGLISNVLAKEDISVDELMEVIKNRIFEED